MVEFLSSVSSKLENDEFMTYYCSLSFVLNYVAMIIINRASDYESALPSMLCLAAYGSNVCIPGICSRIVPECYFQLIFEIMCDVIAANFN